MSDIELLSLAASDASQIAQYSHTLSINLFTYGRRVQNASKVIDALCSEISSTGSALKELSLALSNDSCLQLCSHEAVRIVRNVIEDTKRAFTNIEAFVSNDSNDNRQERSAVKQPRQLSLLERQTDQIRTSLEQLKLSLLLILNVLIFADQLRKKKSLVMMRDQRELIRLLAAERVEINRRLTKATALASQQATSTSNPGSSGNVSAPRFLGPQSKPGHTRAFSAGAVEDFTMSPISASSPMATEQLEIPNVNLHASLRHHFERIQHHSYLVENLLTEISSSRYRLDHGIRDRLHMGILKLHWNEWSRYRSVHGHQVFDQMLFNHEEIVSCILNFSLRISC